jgi:exoribonuclease-2
LDQAKKINPESALDSGREDLSGLYTFTIDGAFTTDFDDALSFEPDADGGGILGVHITDAAALLATEGILDQEAQERGATLYMPDLRIPMLPPSLSEDALSLREGVLRPCLSCLCRLSPEGEVMEYSLKRSVLKVHKRLTYEDADQMLQSDPRLAGLFSACKGLRSQRARAGAYFLPLPEVLVGVDDEGQVWVRRVDRDGPAREMVAETAILANQLKARFLVEHQIPNLYRTQPPPKEPIEEGDPEDLYLHFKQRRLLNPVDITVKPGRHSSLGIEPYTHATSPMRRYLDLVAQRQLGAALAERELPYNEEDLKCLAMKVEPIVRRGFKIRQARQRYWIIKWLAQKKDEAVPGIVMEYQLRRWQVLLTDVMLLTTIPNLPGLSLEPGQDVQLKIDRADPFYDIIKVSLA